MPYVLLFCIAEQAKTFVRRALEFQNSGGEPMFYLVESYNGPSDGQKFKQVLAENEGFETDFIGASEQDCRKWALKRQSEDIWVEKDIIAIADKQSASDDTLSIQYYNSSPGIELQPGGLLPREQDKWYDYRVIYKEAFTVYAALTNGSPGIVYPIYFGRKDELTDERGIFNIAKADELCRGGSSC